MELRQNAEIHRRNGRQRRPGHYCAAGGKISVCLMAINSAAALGKKEIST
jgi:hypothetical protein